MTQLGSVLAALALTFASLVLGCSGSDSPPPPPVEVGIAQSTGKVEASGTVSLSATLVNDTQNQGVTWALIGPGTLSDFTATSVTYNAPPDPLASDTTVNVVAISKRDSSRRSEITITVLARGVSISTPETTVPAGSTTTPRLALNFKGPEHESAGRTEEPIVDSTRSGLPGR
jgi:hypothetical protein